SGRRCGSSAGRSRARADSRSRSAPGGSCSGRSSASACSPPGRARAISSRPRARAFATGGDVNAREVILERVGASAGESPAVTREYRRRGQLAPAQRVALFSERAGEDRAEGRRVEAVAGAVADVCRAHGVRRLAVPAGLPADWRPGGVELVEDSGLTPRELDALDGVLTGSTVAIAETGTIALTAGPGEGRRALTL